jgi:probable F420-dependent oxidoreductase
LRSADGLSIGLVAGGDLHRMAELEQLPIDSLWVGGHVASPNPTPEALMGLARLSAVTQRVKIGTSILLLPLYQPAIVAKQIADLDRATGGRIVLGVGVGGEYAQEFRACGVPIGERGRRVDEAIPLLRRLWTAQQITHEGPFYPMKNVTIHPGPVQLGGPPIVVAGRSDAAMRRAALLGDGWMPYLYSSRRYAASVARIREVAGAANRDLSGFEWYAFIFVNIDADGQRARRAMAATLGGQYNQDFRSMIDHVSAAGTPEEVLEKVQAFVDAGARHLIFTPAAGADNPAAIVDRLVDKVIPLLRA